MNTGLAIGAVIVLLIIIVGGVYFLTRGSTPASSVTTTVAANSSANTSTVAKTTIGSGSGGYSIMVASSATYGQFLTSNAGYTLYTYTGDVKGSGISSCTSGCAENWPPFYIANFTVAPGLNASAFSIINRTGGRVGKQITYKGWPLYLFSGDSAPGAVTGNNVAGFVVATK